MFFFRSTNTPFGKAISLLFDKIWNVRDKLLNLLALVLSEKFELFKYSFTYSNENILISKIFLLLYLWFNCLLFKFSIIFSKYLK